MKGLDLLTIIDWNRDRRRDVIAVPVGDYTEKKANTYNVTGVDFIDGNIVLRIEERKEDKND